MTLELSSKLPMQSVGRFSPSCRSLFYCLKAANTPHLAVHSNVGVPCLALLAPRNALYSRGIVDSDLGIPGILAFSTESKIIDSVVGWLSIFMVQVAWWLLSMVQPPCKPVGGVVQVADIHLKVPMSMRSPRWLACESRIPSLINTLKTRAQLSFLPYHLSRFWIVVQNLAKIFKRHHHGMGYKI